MSRPAGLARMAGRTHGMWETAGAAGRTAGSAVSGSDTRSSRKGRARSRAADSVAPVQACSRIRGRSTCPGAITER
ncbi:hypothetical protein HNR12_001834 [Streptomonospora nanhaiensis]|uniref:Uncharacterized protein n=1 Tax=Streptomonospora nanhaiensis TaxID=1323731 RepID=A0A853BLL5_9ACTN|nr:hypothetical protein [Streptomonospora nanhaiensis]